MMKKKSITGLILFFIVLIYLPVQKISAESMTYTIKGAEENYTYSFHEFWKLYGGYSNTYKRNTITHEMEALKSTVAAINYDTINNQYVSLVTVIEELKANKKQLEAYKQSLLELQSIDKAEPSQIGDEATQAEADEISNIINEVDIQIAAIDAQMLQYNNSKSTAGSSAANAKLQENLAFFYENHQGLLLKDSQNQLKLNFMKECFQLIFEQEQIQYYKEYKDYNSLLYTVEEIKYKNGFSNKQDLELAKLNVLKSKYNLEETENGFQTILKNIQNNTNMKENSSLTLLFDWEKREFDLQKTIEQFLNNNTNYLQLKNMENSYQTYLNSLGITNYASYEQVELQIKDYQLQQNELKYEIEKYVHYAISQYNLALEEIEATKKQMEIAEQNCILVQAKLERKKGTKQDLYRAYTDRTSAGISYYKSIYNILGWETIITNNMYGVIL